VQGWNDVMGDFCSLAFVYFFDCPEAVMEQRLLSRNQGRSDDNIETVRKRFKTYAESTYPIIESFKAKGQVRHIIADRSVAEVYAETRAAYVSIPAVEAALAKQRNKRFALLGAFVAAGAYVAQKLLSK
jgi:guanylate kinase